MYNRIRKSRELGRSLLLVLCYALLIGWALSCEKFVDVDPPGNQLTGALVFEDAATVDAALAYIYAQLREEALTTGKVSGISFLMGNYADELELYSNALPSAQLFANGRVPASDGSVETLWLGSYQLIYQTNSILEGIQKTSALGETDSNRYMGEALFIRSYIHFYLTNLFGAIPYVTTTDYRVNSTIERMEQADLYENLITDLEVAKSMLADIPVETGAFRVNQPIVQAFLARVYLYRQSWEAAAIEAQEVLDLGVYSLSETVTDVFLKDSPETLWQLDSGIPGNNAYEANTFVFTSAPPPNAAISEYLSNAFEEGDQRFEAWVGSVSGEETLYNFPNKYKQNGPTPVTEEFSILIRLPEIYLIAAEANAHLGNLDKAQEFLNAVRSRASLGDIEVNDMEGLLDAILKERRLELFTELGHRFFDLKRTGRLSEVLAPIKPDWNTSSRVLPIPQSELLLNPKLEPQNEGY